MGLTIGRLATRIRIMVASPVQDAWGQPLEAWSELATVWGDFRHVSGIESAKGGSDITQARGSVRIRYRTDITAAMRCEAGGRTYDIKAVLPDLNRKEYVDLVCEAAS